MPSSSLAAPSFRLSTPTRTATSRRASSSLAPCMSSRRDVRPPRPPDTPRSTASHATCAGARVGWRVARRGAGDRGLWRAHLFGSGQHRRLCRLVGARVWRLGAADHGGDAWLALPLWSPRHDEQVCDDLAGRYLQGDARASPVRGYLCGHGRAAPRTRDHLPRVLPRRQGAWHGLRRDGGLL